MLSVEQNYHRAQVAQESKNSLMAKLQFEAYQNDFNFPDISLEEHSFLDVGAGDAGFIHYLRTEKNNSHAYALDQICPKDVPFCVSGSIEKIPYPEKMFDNIVARNIVHALMLQTNSAEKVKSALEECVRVTSEGGTFSYSMHNLNTLRQKIISLDDLSAEQKKTSLQNLSEGERAECVYLEYLSSLGHIVHNIFENNRRIVKITLRKVQ